MSETHTQEKKPLLSPVMRWFMFAMILANIASSMYGIFMPLHIQNLGASVQQVGMIFTISSAVVLIMQIFGGWISDSIGRLKAIAIGSIGGVISFGGILLAPTWQWMILALAVSQFPYALVGPSFSAFIAENSDEHNRGKVYGVIEALYQITGLIGPLLGGWLMDLYDFKTMFAIAAVLYTIAAGFRIWMARTMKSASERPPEAPTIRKLKANVKTLGAMLFGGGVITWVFVTDGISDIAFRLTGEMQPLYLENIGGLNTIQIGLLGTLFSGAMMVIPVFAGRMSDRYGERLPIASGFCLTFISMMIFLQATAFWMFAASWIIFGLGIGMLAPAYQSLISKVVPQNMLGTFQGIFRGSLGFISLPAPYIGGWLWEQYSPKMPFIITAIGVLLIIPPIWLKFKLPDKPNGEGGLKEPEITPASVAAEAD